MYDLYRVTIWYNRGCILIPRVVRLYLSNNFFPFDTKPRLNTYDPCPRHALQVIFLTRNCDILHVFRLNTPRFANPRSLFIKKHYIRSFLAHPIAFKFLQRDITIFGLVNLNGIGVFSHYIMYCLRNLFSRSKLLKASTILIIVTLFTSQIVSSNTALLK